MKSGLISLLFPPRCVSCGELLRFDGMHCEIPALCPECHKQWESEKLETCGICGKAVSDCGCLTGELEKAKCVEFRKSVYYLHGKKDPVQNRIIYRIKDAPDRRATAFLAEELSEPVRKLAQSYALTPRNAVIVWIPRGRGAALRTGTDQAKELAKVISEIVGIPCVPVLARRYGRGKQQKKADRKERRKNALRSYRFRGKTSLEGRSVILVDDIVTTGCSMAACAKILRKAGAGKIFCVAVATDDCNKDPQSRQPTFTIDRKIRNSRIVK